MTTIPKEYKAISADSHLEISAGRWTHLVPKKYLDQAPRTILIEGATDEGSKSGGQTLRNEGHVIGDGKVSMGVGTFDGNNGGGPPGQRLKEQDTDGIAAEVLYPATYTNMFRQIKDEEAYRAVIHAYNQWLAEEYCAYSPDRLIGMGLMPGTGVDGAVREMQECARMGLKGVALNCFPNGNMFPSPEDDLFWAEALAMNMPVTVHVQFAFGPGTTESNATFPLFKYAKTPEVAQESRRDPLRRFITPFTPYAGREIVQMMFAGVFDRFPELQIYFAETNIGWIANWMERMDGQYVKNQDWAEALFGLPRLARRPSDYVREQVLWGLGYNPIGVTQRDYIGGAGRILWYTDFPHPASNWPNSQTWLDENFVGVSEEERYMMTVGNVVKFFHLEGDR